MKLNKKFLASFMTLAMATTPMAAIAANPDGSVVSGTGTVTTLETEIYNVVLPTSESLNFNVDPNGILTMAPGTTLDKLVSGAAGTVTSSATAVINKSSVPLDVKMEFFFDQTDHGNAATNAAFVASNSALSLGATEAEVKAHNAHLYLEVIPLSGVSLKPVVTGTSISLPGPVSNDAFTLSKKALEFNSGYTAVTDDALAITVTGSALGNASGSVISFDLGDVAYAYDVVTGAGTTAGTITAAAVLSESAVEYSTTKDYGYTGSKHKDKEGNIYAFMISGYADPKAEIWNDIVDADSNLKLTVKFTIDKKAEEPEPTDDFVMTANADGSVSYTFVDALTGTLTAISINSVNKPGLVSNRNATYNNGTLTIDSSGVSGVGLNVTGSYTIVATIGGTPCTLTYTK